MSSDTPQRHKRTVPTDEAHRLLSAWERRAILDECHAAGPLDRDALADRLARRSDAAHQDVARLTAVLYHVHLPALADADALTKQGKSYALGPTAPQLLAHLEYSLALGGNREALGQ